MSGLAAYLYALTFVSFAGTLLGTVTAVLKYGDGDKTSSLGGAVIAGLCFLSGLIFATLGDLTK